MRHLQNLLASRWAASLCTLALLLAPAAVHAQTGALEGQVTETATGETLPGVNIVVQGVSLGGATDAQGQYAIEGVPAGTHTVEASFLGYTPSTKEVTVVAGETATVDFTLQSESVNLDEVVVTGTGGQTSRRKVANSISQIDVANVEAPPNNVGSLLSGQAPGIAVNMGEGMSGSGPTIRLRGNSSLSQSNAPLIYVDGLRIQSTGYPKNVPPVGYQGRGANVTSSPLNDINPSDIQSIEVIKGAAAATLFGTEASSGVVQILTKRGQAGETGFRFQVDQGFNRMQRFGPSSEPFMRIDPWLRSGHTQRYNASVSGGSADVQYFVSGTFGDSKGVLPNDSQRKWVARGNFTFSPLDYLQVRWNTMYTNENLENPPAGNNAQGLTINAFRGDNNYFGEYDKAVVDQVLDYKINNYYDHLITGGTATFQPSENVNGTFTVGYDRAEAELRQYRPFGFALAPQGIMSNQRWTESTLTLESINSISIDFSSDLTTDFSIGGQSIWSTINSTTGYAEGFTSTGEPTLSSGSNTLSFEERIREINAGAFVQNILSYKDRYNLTLGLRVDGNSAFGESFGLQPYPKAGLTYIISDEPFWNDGWGTLKLRAAYGHAGTAPGTFDAVRTWSAVGWGGNPAVVPANVGNADLGPERTVETEVGFNAGVFGDRLGLDVTYYDQTTQDALLPVRQPPSEGFPGTQLENVGTLGNRGIEVAVNGTVVDQERFSWDLGVNVSTNQSEVVDLGGAPAFSVSGGGWVEEGGPVPGVRGRRVSNPDEQAEPVFVRDEDGNITYDVFGPNIPTRTVGMNTTFILPMQIRLSARAEYQGGHYINDGASNNMARRAAWPVCSGIGAYDAVAGEGRSELTAMQRARCDTDILSGDFSSFVYPADFVKLRDVTLSLPVPIDVPSVERARFSLSARNIRLWLNEDFMSFDPEMSGQDGLNQITRSITEHIPAPYSISASLSLTL